MARNPRISFTIDNATLRAVKAHAQRESRDLPWTARLLLQGALHALREAESPSLSAFARGEGFVDLEAINLSRAELRERSLAATAELEDLLGKSEKAASRMASVLLEEAKQARIERARQLRTGRLKAVR